jgi:hypothetical protein
VTRIRDQLRLGLRDELAIEIRWQGIEGTRDDRGLRRVDVTRSQGSPDSGPPTHRLGLPLRADAGRRGLPTFHCQPRPSGAGTPVLGHVVRRTDQPQPQPLQPRQLPVDRDHRPRLVARRQERRVEVGHVVEGVVDRRQRP